MFYNNIGSKIKFDVEVTEKTSQTHFAAIDWNTVSESTVAAWSLTLI